MCKIADIKNQAETIISLDTELKDTKNLFQKCQTKLEYISSKLVTTEKKYKDLFKTHTVMTKEKIELSKRLEISKKDSSLK